MKKCLFVFALLYLGLFQYQYTTAWGEPDKYGDLSKAAVECMKDTNLVTIAQKEYCLLGKSGLYGDKWCPFIKEHGNEYSLTKKMFSCQDDPLDSKVKPETYGVYSTCMIPEMNLVRRYREAEAAYTEWSKTHGKLYHSDASIQYAKLQRELLGKLFKCYSEGDWLKFLNDHIHEF